MSSGCRRGCEVVEVLHPQFSSALETVAENHYVLVNLSKLFIQAWSTPQCLFAHVRFTIPFLSSSPASSGSPSLHSMSSSPTAKMVSPSRLSRGRGCSVLAAGFGLLVRSAGVPTLPIPPSPPREALAPPPNASRSRSRSPSLPFFACPSGESRSSRLSRLWMERISKPSSSSCASYPCVSTQSPIELGC